MKSKQRKQETAKTHSKENDTYLKQVGFQCERRHPSACSEIVSSRKVGPRLRQTSFLSTALGHLRAGCAGCAGSVLSIRSEDGRP